MTEFHVDGGWFIPADAENRFYGAGFCNVAFRAADALGRINYCFH